MSTPTPTLQEFIQPALCCQPTESLEAARSQIRMARTSAIAVVNDGGILLGVLTWEQLVFTQEEAEPASLVSLAVEATCLEAKLPLSALTSFLAQWQQQPPRVPPAIVDEQGQFLGWLDCWSALATALAPRQQEKSNTITLSNQSCTALAPLRAAIEKLPFPLLLEASDGRVLLHNQAWREKICQSQLCLWGEERGDRLDLEDSATRGQHNLAPQLGYPDNRATVKTAIDTCGACILSDRGSQRPPTAWQFTRIPLKALPGDGDGSETWCPCEPELDGDSVRNARPGASRKAMGGPSAVAAADLYLVLATDLTEHQQLCRELTAKNADLVQLNRLKDEFLACISHELKSPLTAVVGLSSLLQEPSLGQLNQRQERYAGMIYQSGRQLMTLVNDILDLTRLETGQLELDLEPVSITRVCDRAYKQARQGLGEDTEEIGQIHYRFSLEPGLETLVADELRLHQMLVHLLTNALKFTSQGGEVGLEVNAWEGWIAFTVWDTGIGIPAASQHLIFQKFQQLENPLTRQFEGTGLGLVLTQRLARAHGGDVSFISEAGKGSQFTLLLPPVPPEGTQHSVPEASRKHGAMARSHKLVLLVETVPSYIEQAVRVCRSLGLRVAIARSGTEAVAKARTFKPRGILLNPLLPLLSGWDVLTLLKSDPSTSSIPVVVTATGADAREAIARGADGFLPLPLSSEALADSPIGDDSPPTATPSSLTLLRLNGVSGDPLLTATSGSNGHQEEEWLASAVARFDCRLLEAEDLEQAELLAQIWNPQGILLGATPVADSYVQELAQRPHLARLPIVALDADTARSAAMEEKLTVYPCLVDPREGSGKALADGIFVALGTIHPRSQDGPRLLAIDGKTNSVGEASSTVCQGERTPAGGDRETRSSGNWLQASMQYLEMAGYRAAIASSWSEIYTHIERGGVDLVLLDLGRDGKADPSCIAGVEGLMDLATQVPLLVLASVPPEGALGSLLARVKAKIVPGHSQSMTELLAQIEGMLTNTVEFGNGSSFYPATQ